MKVTPSHSEAAAAGRPVAIVDIGSNSVRLVAYDTLDRSPTPSFNEKALCALGHGVVSTGKLSKGAIVKALAALRRFRVLIELMGVEDVHVIATAAARDAANGPEFLRAAREALGGLEVKLLSGQREATLSAFGVLSGIHDPDGVVGDLGGGSLELIDVKGGVAGEGISLPLGGLALMDASQRSPKAAAKIARDALAGCRNLDALQGRTFYAVGGTAATIRCSARPTSSSASLPARPTMPSSSQPGWAPFLRPWGCPRRATSAACVRRLATFQRLIGAPIRTIAACKASTSYRARSCPASITRSAPTCRWWPRFATSASTRGWHRRPASSCRPG